MKIIIKKILIIVGMFFLAMIMLIGESKAALQANPNTHYQKVDSITNWMVDIRNMEKSGEAMGLNETLNTDLTPLSESNNIDVHFLRSTEYGAVAILSASGYGNPQILQESTIKTTTGNKTGVYFSGEHWEWVSARVETAPAGGDSRYYDSYTGVQESARVGDALGDSTTSNPGCTSWHSASYAAWISSKSPLFIRGYSGLFSYDYTSSTGWDRSARGVAVCGTGL